MGDPEVAKVQATVIRALRPFPEARAAVVEALDQLAAISGSLKWHKARQRADVRMFPGILAATAAASRF
jgi:hypothetical protein